MRIVLLASGSGTLTQAVIDAFADSDRGVEIVGVGSDSQMAGVLDRATEHSIPTFVVRPKDCDSREEWNVRLRDAVAELSPDWVISAGFMRILGPLFIAAFENRIINTHPALLPSFPGAHGVRDALAHGVRVTGGTIHLVDSGVDTGPIITQFAVSVGDEDTEGTVHERIKTQERTELVRLLDHLADHDLVIDGRRVSGYTTTNRQPILQGGLVTGTRAIKRALISVYDKSGLEDLARGLHAAGVQIVSTGSTAAKIAEAGAEVTKVEELTGFPECLEGRVKTLHPRVHAGILADSRKPDHMNQLDELDIEPFDLVIVNLYPFAETVASGASFDDCVEQIDIGGPSMVRAAAKNHPSVSVITDPTDYPAVLEAAQGQGFDIGARRGFAARAFAHTAAYDTAVASWFASELAADGGDEVDAASATTVQPAFAGVTGEKLTDLRYGENPHQAAAVYSDGTRGIAGAKLLGGKAMSYNNYTDTDAAIRAAFDFDRPAVAIIKHANPCGIAVADTAAAAHKAAHECDSLSAYGGVIATNCEVDAELAASIRPIFTECLAAPSFTDEALEILSGKKNLRLLELGDVDFAPAEIKPITGGFLVQERDAFQAEGDSSQNWTLAAGSAASPEVLADLEFAWKACRAVKSNAILVAKGGASVGVGMGQVNRVDSAKLAVERAGEQRAPGAVAASDAFFPFADGLQILLDAGISAVVQPGGSIRDDEVIAAAEKAGVTMYLTGSRHFFH